MKGTVVVCLREMVAHDWGDERWNEIATACGISPFRVFLTWEDVPDAQVGQLMVATETILGLTTQQLYDAFGEHWMCRFGPRVYKAYYDGKRSAREFLEFQDNVHVVVTNTMANAMPPRFRCDWVDERTMVMHYNSHRGMVDLMIGFIKGVGKYYKEDLRVRKLSSTRVEVAFIDKRETLQQ